MNTENLPDVHDSMSDDAITMAGLSFVNSTVLTLPPSLALPIHGLTLVPQVDLSGSLTGDVECLPINAANDAISLEDSDLALASQETMLNIQDHHPDAVELKFQQDHDHIEEVHKISAPVGVESPVGDVDVNGDPVYLIYQDILTCGTCNKHFLDLLDFLKHKASHAIASEAYKCELCKMLLINVAMLREHYTRKHHVHFDTVNGILTSCDGLLNDSLPSESGEISADAVANGSIDIVITKSEPRVDVVAVDSTPRRGSRRGRRKATHRAGSDTVEVDFLFTLNHELKQDGTSQDSCACLHCTYRNEDRHALSTHMLVCHANILAAGVSANWTQTTANVHGSCVMRMSKYNHTCMPAIVTKKKPRRHRKLEKQDIPGHYPCATCGKMFGRLRYLRKHEETHCTERRFACGACGASFKSKTYLSVHVRCVHGRPREFRCTRCDFTSRVSAAIQAHRQLHAQPGAVRCDICALAYADRATLNKHKRVHDKSRPYACTHAGCTWRFNTEHMCRAHARAHTTPAAFRCSVCGYAFRHKHHLQRHEANMHDIAHPKTRCTTNRRKASTTVTTPTTPPDMGEATLTSVTDTSLISTIDTPHMDSNHVFHLHSDITGEVVLSL